MALEKPESFVYTWLKKLQAANPDSAVRQAITESTKNDILDEDALLESLKDSASDIAEGDNGVSNKKS